MTSPHLSEAAAVNWLWLADTRRRDRALVVANSAAPWTGALLRHFASVDYTTTTELRARIHARGRARSGPDDPILAAADRSLDCIALPGFIGEWKATATGLTYRAACRVVARECERLLRSGGVLFLSGPNPLWHRRIRVGESSRGRELRRALLAAGLHSVRAYYADPSDVEPTAIIPACRAAALGYERQERARRGRGPHFLAVAGLHALAYPAQLMLAFA